MMENNGSGGDPLGCSGKIGNWTTAAEEIALSVTGSFSFEF